MDEVDDHLSRFLSAIKNLAPALYVYLILLNIIFLTCKFSIIDLNLFNYLSVEKILITPLYNNFQEYFIVFLLIIKEYYFTRNDQIFEKFKHKIIFVAFTLILISLIILNFLSIQNLKTQSDQSQYSLLNYCYALVFAYTISSFWAKYIEDLNYRNTVLCSMLLFALPMISAYNGFQEGYKIILDDMNGALFFDATNSNIDLLKKDKLKYIDNFNQDLLLYSTSNKSIIIYKLSPSDLYSLKKFTKKS